RVFPVEREWSAMEEFYKLKRPVWRKRNAEHRPEAHRKNVSSLIKTLGELEKKTRPSGGVKTERGKDLAAFQALKFAGYLVDAVAGWALDHQVGLALSRLEFLPLGPQSLRRSPEYIAAKSLVDSHSNEREGGAAFSGASTNRLGIVEKRILLRNLLYANPGAFEPSIALELQEGLKELEFGWYTQLLRATTLKSQSRLRWIRCRLGAICFIAYERGRKKRKIEALETAANEFGVDVGTLDTWEKRLPKEIGKLEVARWRQFAYHNGTQVRADPAFRGLRNFGMENLQSYAREYKAIMRERTSRHINKIKSKRIKTRARRSDNSAVARFTSIRNA
ncbi:MAG: hypothetical protein WBE48_00720, partial [Xanthobacteraceae bacterium]